MTRKNIDISRIVRPIIFIAIGIVIGIVIGRANIAPRSAEGVNVGEPERQAVSRAGNLRHDPPRFVPVARAESHGVAVLKAGFNVVDVRRAEVVETFLLA